MNCFGSLWTTWFIKSRAVDNPLSDVSVDHDPRPDLTLVNDTLQNLTLVDNHILDSPAVYIPPPDDHRADGDLALVEKPFVPHPSVDNDHLLNCVLPVVDNSTDHVPTVQTTLLDLPYHIITDILIRLPAECVVRCQRAFKLLELLTRTPLFIRTHLACQDTSIIALQSFSQSSDRVIKCYFIDEQAESVHKAKLKLDFCYSQKNDPVMIYDSYDGFLLFKNTNNSRASIFVIWNPTTEEQVTITMEGWVFQVCGFYFNPHNKKYEVLLAYRVYERSRRECFFDVLSFGSKLRRNIGRYSYMPTSKRPPTIINGTLYWMVDEVYSNFGNPEFTCSNSIMAFDIGTNKFSTMQHGGASCVNPARYYTKHDYMRLFEMKGQLGLCLTKNPFVPNAELTLWVLNTATNSWTNTHTVTFPIHSKPKYFSFLPNGMSVEIVKMKDGKLLVRQEERLLLWDLDLNTHKIVEKKGFESDNFRPVIHTYSLVSLDTDKFIHLDAEKR